MESMLSPSFTSDWMISLVRFPLFAVDVVLSSISKGSSVVPCPINVVGRGRGLVRLSSRITMYWALLCSYQAFVLEVCSIIALVGGESVMG